MKTQSIKVGDGKANYSTMLRMANNNKVETQAEKTAQQLLRESQFQENPTTVLYNVVEERAFWEWRSN